MSNIIGKNFDSWVTNQINVRQEKIINKSNSESLIWQNNNSAWVRLVSSVNITPNKSRELTGQNTFSGNKLANSYVLFGGVKEENLPFGVSTKYGWPHLENIPLYGFHGDKDRGLVPLPGIENAIIEYLNRGALRKADITIKAHNLNQFKVIDALYMRPGYTVLLEWGNSLYFDNNKRYKKADYNNKAFDLIKKQTSSFDKILHQIREDRKTYHGNYDGFLGKITNFSWTLENDGSYTIIIKMVSIGDIIESLNINRTTISIDDSGETIQGNALKTFLNLIEKSNEMLGGTLLKPRDDSEATFPISYYDKSNLKKDIVGFPDKKFEGDDTFPCYIRLRNILKYINENLLLYNKKDENLIKIDIGNNNFCYTFPSQFSLNPNICLIPFQSFKRQTGSSYYSFNSLSKYFYEILGDDFRKPDSEFVGNLLDIHVNFNHVKDTLNECLNDEAEIILLDFLNKLMREIQLSLGGVNRFTVSYDSDENLIKIYDDIPLDNKVTKSTQGNLAKFNIISHKNNIGSLITNISLTTSITSELSSMVTIGAQSGKSTDILDATAFSKWNEGLIDSTFKERESKVISNIEISEEEEAAYSNPLFIFNKNWRQLIGGRVGTTYEASPLFKFYNLPNFYPSLGEIEMSLDVGAESFRYLRGFYQEYHNVPSTQGFIPFDLGLEMNGISGMKIYERFEILDKELVLPPSYPPNLWFLVKGIRHDINVKGWTTTLNSLTCPPITSTSSTPKKDYPNAVEVLPPGEGDMRNVTINIQRGLNRKLIEKYGWPIIVEEDPQGTFKSKVTSVSNTSNTGALYSFARFDVNPAYDKKCMVVYSWRGAPSMDPIHKDLKPYMDIILDEIHKSNPERIHVKTLSTGLSPREVSSRNNKGILSLHAFAYAFDINAGDFPQGTVGKYRYDLIKRTIEGGGRSLTPEEKEIVRKYRKTGLAIYRIEQYIKKSELKNLIRWGGDFTTTPDVHHFELTEQGMNMVEHFNRLKATS